MQTFRQTGFRSAIRQTSMDTARLIRAPEQTKLLQASCTDFHNFCLSADQADTESLILLGTDRDRE